MMFDMSTVLGMGLLLAAGSTGCGALVVRALLRDPAPRPESCFWIGWSTWLGVLQLLHFRWPLSAGWIDLAFAALGGAGWALYGGALARPILSSLRAHKRAWAIAALVGLWLCNRSLGPLRSIDAGLYHLGSIKWAAEHPLVAGLANLHGRLAFNSSAFLWLASLDPGAGALRGFQLGPGLLIAVAAAGRTARVLAARERCRRVFEAVLLLPLAYAVAVMHASSTSPDWIVLATGIVLASFLADFLRAAPGAERVHPILVIAALCAAGITLKLSFAPLAAATLGLVALGLARPPVGGHRALLGAAFLLTFLLLPWCLRGIELSGYPAYPSTLLASGASWQVPADRAEAEVRWIRSWARAPGRNPDEVLGRADWIVPWLTRRLSSADSIALLVFPFAMLGLAAVGRERPLLRGRLLLPFALAALAWFATAPDPRFLGASAWVCAAAFAAGPTRRGAAGRVATIGMAVCAVGFASFVLVMANAVGGLWIAPGPAHGRYPLRQVDTREFRTRTGLVLHVPREGDQCWEAPLPCTPYPAPRLGLRREDEPWGGFELNNDR